MISQNLLRLRKLHGFSQEQIAEKIMVSRQAVAKWENGDTMPDLTKCMELAKLYDVTIDALINYREEAAEGLPIPPKGKHFFGKVTLGERGQIVIPKKARDVFTLNPGDDLIVLGDEEQGLALMKADVMINFLNSMTKD